MHRYDRDQCRRCGSFHEELCQLVDPGSCWAITLVECPCGHRWTTIHTSPENLRPLRAWVIRGCHSEDVPVTNAGSRWHCYRLEGLFSPAVPTAS